MPFTPYHFGPAFAFGLLLNRFINLTTFIVANVIIDIEPFVVLFFNLDYPLHGFLHSFLGGSVIAVILSLMMIALSNKIQKLTSFIGIKQNFSKKAIWVASFSGIYLHILFDAPLYTDIKPFYPFAANPFYGSLSSWTIYNACAILFFIGISIYLFMLFKKK
jgi:membrane-bound metal-dependent hydrolase YbcI (DUF457 family)